MNFRWIAFFCLLAAPLWAEAQTPTRPSATAKANTVPPDYSQEPFVVEQYITHTRFENDGTGEENLRVRVRLQSDASIEQWNHLTFGYNAASESIDVRYVRIRRKGSGVVEVGADAIKDAQSPAVADAPAYSNCREKRISIPSLAPGDTLEYAVDKTLKAPKAPGEFWFEHSFVETAVVLNEQLEVNIPNGRTVTLKSKTPYEMEQLEGRTIYRWKHANLRHEDIPRKDSAGTEGKPPDVQLTSFESWREIARWYEKLGQQSEEPTDTLRSKTQQLIQSERNNRDKAEAIYDYVAKKIRSVALDFGAASYQPRPAEETLSSQYGDSQDKNALLEAMLRAAGFQSEMVLIPSQRRLDPTVPSPGQFDRILTVAQVGDHPVWMDPALDVAPFGLLPAPMRGKSALLISAEGSGKIVETPADPPFLSTQSVEVDAELTPLGKLTGHVHYSVRGDTELALRTAFHTAPAKNWEGIAQTILALDGIHGDVTSVKCSDPTDTRNPFELDVDFAQSNFVTWSNLRTNARMPLLNIGLPDPPSNTSKPIDLGSPLNVAVELKLTLPATFAARAPAALGLARDFAEFKSSYTFSNHVVTATRSLDFKTRDLSASRREEYLAFERAVAADQNQLLLVENTAPGGPVIPANAGADELAEAGHGALDARNSLAAIPLLQRSVELDARHKSAWNDLGLAYLDQGKLDDSISAFQTHLRINPSDEHANQYLGVAFERKQDYESAAAAFLKQTQINPLDAVAHASLGEALLGQHEYTGAVPELEKATILAPRDAQFQESLGSAYAGAGKADEAVAAFEKAAELSPSAEILNAAAFDLAEQKLALDKAQRFAELAISATTTRLRNASLPHVANPELNAVEELAADWDTLGWVYFQKGDLDRALPYIRSAWMLSEDGEAGDHLAQIYEKSGDKQAAIRTCALALAAPHAIPDTRARLTLLLGGNSQIDSLVADARSQLAALRTISAGNLLVKDAKADFLVLLSPGGKQARVDAIRFMSGSEELRPFAARLRALNYGAVFPDSSPAELIRRGTLSCSAAAPCTFTLIPPEEVRPDK